jgi:hypothetical protein
LGLIDDDQYTKDLTRHRQEKMSAAETMAAAYKDKGEYEGVAIPDIREILNSPEAQMLTDKGLVLVSSKTQLAKGTLIWAKPGYTRHASWGLGFYPSLGKIRRMAPKNIELGLYSHRHRIGSMDITIKDIPKSVYSSPLEFYKIAMKWAAEHIDWEQLEQAEALGDSEWRYFVKRKTRRNYFN